MHVEEDGWILPSRHLGAPRRIWCDEGAGPIALFLDGDFYRDRVHAMHVVADQGMRGVWVAAGTSEDRHRDLTCSAPFERFVVDELLPRLDGEVDLLVGLSLSGLMAAHLALTHPAHFGRAICQSPSAWWNDEALAARASAGGGGHARVWISVGAQETATDVRHPPTGLHQRTSQVDSCRRLAEAWGSRARLEVFEGGHDPACWRAELPAAMAWARA